MGGTPFEEQTNIPEQMDEVKPSNSQQDDSSIADLQSMELKEDSPPGAEDQTPFRTYNVNTNPFSLADLLAK